ncbi:MAG: hypothetical protein RBR82_15845, partial [Pseudomonas sp.]|nr:hypothetical protein [Pseudomonas sp.]
SGYVIVQAAYSDRHSMCGLLSDKHSFLTPDDNSQAIPVEITAGGGTVAVYNKIVIGKTAQKIATITTAGSGRALTYEGFTRDGRTAFFSNDIRASIVFLSEEFWPILNPELTRTDIAGSVIGNVSTVTVARSDLTIAAPLTTQSFEQSQLYAHFKRGPSTEAGPGPIIMYEDEIGPNLPSPGWGATTGHSNSLSSLEVPCFLFIGDASVETVIGKKIALSNSVTTGSWGLSESEQYNTVSGSTSHSSSSSYEISYSHNGLEFIKLFFDSSSITVDDVVLRMENVSGDQYYTQYDTLVTSAISLTMDGVSIFDLPGYQWFDNLNTGPTVFVDWFNGSANPPIASSAARSYRALELAGRGAVMVSIYLNPYSCLDIMSVAVLVKRGQLLIDPPGGGNQVDLTTVTQTLYIGNCFAGGTVLNDPVVIDEVDFEKPLYRAFDPLTKTISPVYEWPVFYQ